MSHSETNLRQTLIVQELRKHPCTYAEIADFINSKSQLKGFFFTMSKRTFKRDIDDILDIYYIEIKLNFSRKKYYIDSESAAPEISDRMLDAMNTIRALKIDNIEPFLHPEKRRARGSEHLFDLLYATKNRFIATFSYQKYWEEKASQRRVESYALKEFEGRWYLIAKDLENEQIRTFALDRISGLEISAKKFKAVEYNVEEEFKNCYGITNNTNAKIEKIVLSFDEVQGKYIKSLPLHETQEIEYENEGEVCIKLQLRITHDFIMKLFSFGNSVEVIQPQSLRNKIKKAHQEAYELYL
jgi:predicted DNA-binding transcriptional regulator YafY